MKTPALILFATLAVAPSASAQNGIELASRDGFWRVGVRPTLELTYWHADTPLPGLIDFTGTDFFQPRLSLGFTVVAGDEWLLHILARWDRGFEVGAQPDGDFRLDEAFLRWRPLGDGRLNVTLGKFATCFGNWVPRHGFWDDPFLMPPLPYDSLLAVNNRNASSPSAAAVANRTTSKRSWVPMIWGPVYSTGVSLSGSTALWDYAAEVKNASLVTQPDGWNPTEENGSHPTFTGRIGYRPDAAWSFGLSASHGNYLRHDAEPTLPVGSERRDFTHSVIGADVRWSHHQFQVLGEVLASRSRTAVAGDLDAIAYYVEARWKVNSTLFVAARWAQQWNEDFASGAASSVRGYTREVWRATAAAGFRITENVLVKTEYSYHGGNAKENAFALGIGLKF